MSSLDSTVSLLHVFGDATRVRLMVLLGREELSVAELTAITELPQSRVSTHLGRLRDAGLVRDRRMGSSTFYALNEGAMPEEARRVWQLLEGEVSDGVIEADRARSDSLRKAREQASWPDSIAGEMERHYSPGRTWEAMARGLLGFVRLGNVLDVGSGDGVMAQLLASRAESITCLDRSSKMIEAARRRLAAQQNVRFEVGDMHELPFKNGSFDQVLLFNVLTYASEPSRALAEAARVLSRGGTLAVVTLNAHTQESTTTAYNHLQPGFRVSELRSMLEQVGLEVSLCEISSRERKKPYFEILNAFAKSPELVSLRSTSRDRDGKNGSENAAQ